MSRNIIAKLTLDCMREDCRVSHIFSAQTLAAHTTYYDKQGNQIADKSGDPNTFTSSYECSSCGIRWTVISKRGEETIKTELPGDFVGPEATGVPEK